MTSSRLEAFSDGVLAVIITVMVLELKPPAGEQFSNFVHSTGLGLLTYLLSFIYVGIYWNNHHHMFQLVESVNGSVLWANLHLLFWISLFPFTTSWVDDTHIARDPAILYGLNLLAAALAYYLLQQAVFHAPGGDRLREAVGPDFKGRWSPAFYITGIALTFGVPWLAMVPNVAVALMWLIPDRRVERYLERVERGD